MAANLHLSPKGFAIWLGFPQIPRRRRQRAGPGPAVARNNEAAISANYGSGIQLHINLGYPLSLGD